VVNSRDPRTPDTFVSFKSGTDGSVAIARLEGELGFVVKWQPQDQSGFLSDLTDAQRAVVQCDGAVAFLEWNSVGTTADHAPAT
jgi:hypothetical protein